MVRISMFLVAMLANVVAMAQHQRAVQGTVVDAKSRAPIPFAHLIIDGTQSGTVSNLEGKFNINLPIHSSTRLICTSIGYKKTAILVETNVNLITIPMTEEVWQLKPLTIVAVDHAKELVTKAIDQIPLNYGNSPQRLTGFIRQIVSSDSLAEKPFHISEAELSISKQGYEKKTIDGDVQLLKGRKIISNTTDSLKINIYGAAHLAHRFDVAAARSGPLGKIDIKDFEFDIIDTLSWGGKMLFKVAFYPNKRNMPEGELYILEENFAIVKAIYRYNREALRGLRQVLGSHERQYLHYTTEYFQQDKWYIGRVEYSSAFEQSKQRLIYLNSRYTTHAIAPEETPIPYPERIQMRDFLLESVDNYENGYWDGYNIVVPEAPIEEYFEKIKENGGLQQESKRTGLNTFLRKIKFGYELMAAPSLWPSHQIDFSQNQFSLQKTMAETQKTIVAVQSTMYFDLTKHWFINLQFSGNFTTSDYSDFRAGVGYGVNVRPKKRPLYIAPMLSIGNGTNAQFIEQMSVDGPIGTKGKRIKSGSADAYSMIIKTNLLPGLLITHERSKRFSYTLGVQHAIVLEQKHGLLISQKQNFFSRRGMFIDSTPNEINYSTKEKLQQPWLVFFGIRWGL